MPHPTSAEIAARIEELYGASLNDLDAHAKDHPPGMLAALLGSHDQLAFAEQSITVHRQRLQQLVHPERQIGTHEVSHILDCARRLAEAVAVRDTQAATTQAVLQSLGRTPAPQPPTTSAPAAVPAPPVPTMSAAPSR
ncbi:hypothetical protein [Streptomyces aurantiogriseus]|uniref:Uncharacterized protein n=1 Tax=Streptomyces aurantiogriseus TaxID=66870 RepID=A0A918FG23_9ACTN|nr:hypothetical protein [Streptomyces aurantiogriseus]GGR35577.1 hypothetical protein GCM10010251_59950 [Streptomyces aurantiogriseus]